MRFLVVLGFVIVLSGCAAVKGQRSYTSPGIIAPTNSPLDVAAYNLEIRRQGIDHYCGSGVCDTLPVLLQAYAPIYPIEKQKAGIDGSATIGFDILKDGTLANFKVESASARAFADAAIQALKLWRFSPPTLNGVPVKTTSQQRFPFVAL